jgi:uncharacterized protein with HEPN domain
VTRDEERISDIQSAAGRVDEIVSRGREAFDADHILQAALTHNIQVICEAAVQLSGDARTHHPDVPWSEIVGMRNIVVHRYFDVDLDMVWRTAEIAVPDLKHNLSG